MELFKAHNQWSNRPADERFWDLNEMLETAKVVKRQAVEKSATIANLRVEANAGDLVLIGKSGVQAQISNYAFGQLSSRVGAPASYLRELPATLAAQNLNHGLKTLGEDKDATDAKLLFNVNGSVVLRAATTMRYGRIWTSDMLEKILENLPSNWKTPRAWPVGISGERTRAATADDVMDGSIIKLGDTIAPAGAYLSDRDMFIFLIDTESEIRTGTKMPLHRGLMFWNSEVGAKSFGGMAFEFGTCCGNHRILGAQNVLEFNHRHIGDVSGNLARSFEMTFKSLSNDSVSDREAKIAAERRLILGANKEEVLDAVLAYAKKSKIDRINNKLLDAAYDKAVEHQDWYGDPNSLYGITNGITEVAQVVTQHADDRHDIDMAAGKLLAMASEF